MTRFIYDINSATPDGSDEIANGDDEIRLLKSDIKATFPKLAGEVSASQTEINRLVGLSGNIFTDGGGTITGTVAFRGPISINNDVSISGGVVVVGTTRFEADVTISGTLVTSTHIRGETAFFGSDVSISGTLVCTVPVKGVDPTDSSHLTTKSYVLAAISGGGDPTAVDVTAFKRARLKLFYYGQL